jgi:hypothetical protein
VTSALVDLLSFSAAPRSRYLSAASRAESAAFSAESIQRVDLLLHRRVDVVDQLSRRSGVAPLLLQHQSVLLHRRGRGALLGGGLVDGVAVDLLHRRGVALARRPVLLGVGERVENLLLVAG